MSVEWVTVYDFSDESYRYGLMVMPVIMTVFGCGLAFLARIKLSKGFRQVFIVVFGMIFASFSFVIGGLTLGQDITNYHESKEVYKNQRYEVIEGIVENFKPMPIAGHQHESFTVNGITFSYADSDWRYYGFHTTKVHGGPIEAGLMVRLSYYQAKGQKVILRVEIPQ